jgi:prepilin-type N-terminal cleavage/methylation domain-containing protein
LRVDNERAVQPDEVLSKFPSPCGLAVPIATVAQGGTVADVESRNEDEQGLTRAGRDRGFSIIEVIVTLTLMAVVLVPILSAVAVTVRSSSQGRSAAQVETALVNAADRINRAPKTCDYTIYAQAAVQSQGWEPDRATVQHSYYKPGPSPSFADGASATWVEGQACEFSTATEGLVQRVVISVTSPDGDIRREMQVVKSDV